LFTALVLFMGFVCLACDRTEITDAGPKLEPAAKLKGRHVIVISFDTLRVDHLGFMGNDWIRTPRLDSLAETSIVFEDHQTVVPTTLASHSTIFTGNHPHHHGTPGNGWMVNSKNDMLAEVLKRAGFVTAGFVASFALESRFGFAQGFDHYSEEFDVLVGERAADQNHRSAEAVTNSVLEYLDAEPTPENLFLFIHYFDPHHPYSETGSFVDLYANADIPLVVHPARRKERLRALRLARRYAAEVSYLDHHVGRLLLGLQVRGILDDSILVVTSDHGENFIEHGKSFNHGLTVYEPAMRSLWLMRMPRGEKGGMRMRRRLGSVSRHWAISWSRRFPVSAAPGFAPTGERAGAIRSPSRAAGSSDPRPRPRRETRCRSGSRDRGRESDTGRRSGPVRLRPRAHA
jgi:arylsulfatase A-like enzyme